MALIPADFCGGFVMVEERGVENEAGKAQKLKINKIGEIKSREQCWVHDCCRNPAPNNESPKNVIMT